MIQLPFRCPFRCQRRGFGLHWLLAEDIRKVTSKDIQRVSSDAQRKRNGSLRVPSWSRALQTWPLPNSLERGHDWPKKSAGMTSSAQSVAITPKRPPAGPRLASYIPPNKYPLAAEQVRSFPRERSEAARLTRLPRWRWRSVSETHSSPADLRSPELRSPDTQRILPSGKWTSCTPLNDPCKTNNYGESV